MPEGVTSASLIVVILVAAAVGAAVGGMLGPNFDPPVLAVISGFIATIVAVFVRNELINRLSGAGPNDFKIPLVVAIFAIVASLAGTAVEFYDFYIYATAAALVFGPLFFPRSILDVTQAAGAIPIEAEISTLVPPIANGSTSASRIRCLRTLSGALSMPKPDSTLSGVRCATRSSALPFFTANTTLLPFLMPNSRRTSVR